MIQYLEVKSLNKCDFVYIFFNYFSRLCELEKHITESIICYSYYVKLHRHTPSVDAANLTVSYKIDVVTNPETYVFGALEHKQTS